MNSNTIHNSKKHFYEYLAKMLLETFIPEQYTDLVPADKPDLRQGDNIGIEVTRILLEGEGQASGIFQHIRGKSDFNPKYKETLERIDYNLICHNGIVVGYGPNEATTVDNEPLKQAFQKKCAKEYELPIVDLFLFSPSYNWFEETYIKQFMEWTICNGGNKFRNIIIYEKPYIYVFNTDSQSMNTINMDSDKIDQCIETARQCVFHR